MIALRGYALAIARLAFGAVFLYAASTKIADMRVFAEEVANYHVVPPALVALSAAAVVGTELLAGLLLLVGARTRASARVPHSLPAW